MLSSRRPIVVSHGIHTRKEQKENAFTNRVNKELTQRLPDTKSKLFVSKKLSKLINEEKNEWSAPSSTQVSTVQRHQTQGKTGTTTEDAWFQNRSFDKSSCVSSLKNSFRISEQSQVVQRAGNEAHSETPSVI